MRPLSAWFNRKNRSAWRRILRAETETTASAEGSQGKLNLTHSDRANAKRRARKKYFEWRRAQNAGKVKK